MSNNNKDNMADSTNDIYNLDYLFYFKNQGVEKKYLQQTSNYFSGSYKFLLFFVPLFLILEQLSVLNLCIFLPLLLNHSSISLRSSTFIVTTLNPGSLALALLADWIIHLYTLRSPGSYLVFLLSKLLYWFTFEYTIDLDLTLSSLVLVYFTVNLQGSFRSLWKEIETNKRKMIQEKTILNEIQCAVIVFDVSGTILSTNTKGLSFLKTRGISNTEKLQIYEIFPECCQIRIKDLFSKALKGDQTDEEFLFSHELDSIPPVFSAVVISLKKVENSGTVRVQMTVIDICNTIMRRRFLASNQRMIEESSLIIESEFIELYLGQKPLKNHHIRSLSHYLLDQRDLLVLMNNYIGESEVINEFFAIKDEVVNTVHICWRGAKAKRMKMLLICEQVLPKQVFGDHVKHNQLLKSLLEFAILTGDMGSDISVNVALRKFIHGASIEYKFIYYSKTLTLEELENIFRIRKHSKKPKVLEEMIEICERYGLGISIFDVLLTIINGYVGEILVQESINRVIISYM